MLVYTKTGGILGPAFPQTHRDNFELIDFCDRARYRERQSRSSVTLLYRNRKFPDSVRFHSNILQQLGWCRRPGIPAPIFFFCFFRVILGTRNSQNKNCLHSLKFIAFFFSLWLLLSRVRVCRESDDDDDDDDERAARGFSPLLLSLSLVFFRLGWCRPWAQLVPVPSYANSVMHAICGSGDGPARLTISEKRIA